jgi:hypothetical protein
MKTISQTNKDKGFSTFLSFPFWDSVFVKITESLVSVKVWGLISITTLSSIFLVKGYISGGDWVTINSSVYGIIYGMREIFKMSRIKVFEDKVKESGTTDWKEIGEEARNMGLMR